MVPLDSCCMQHMVGFERYISNTVSTPAVTYVTVANNTRLRASAQGVVVLKARGIRTHITLNDVRIVQNLSFNLLSAAQLMEYGVDLSTDPETRDILLHYTAPNKAHKQIGQAQSENGVYILDLDIPNCSGDSQELMDLVPLRFEHIHHRDWKHPNGRPWVPHHPHPCELALHDPDPDGICRDCHTPSASTSAIAGRGLAAIAEAEREAPPAEGMSNLELEIATRGVFRTEENPLPGSASQHLRGMLRGTGVGTLDAHGVPRPYTKDKFMEIHPHWRDPTMKLTVAEEEELARREKRKALPMNGGGGALAGGVRATQADGELPLVETLANGAPHLAARQVAGAPPAKARELPARTNGGRKKMHNLLLFLLVALRAALLLHYLHLTSSRTATPKTPLTGVYSDFLNVGHCGINDELYTLTFVDTRTHYVWVVNVEVRGRAYEVFRLWLAHSQWQSGEKLKIWQSDGAAEFRVNELRDYLAQKGIEHHISLPYAHQQQGVSERTNRTLMMKVRALMKQSKLPPIYWTYAMHHAVRMHNLLSTTAITGNSSPHVKWTGTKGDTSMLCVEDEKANANHVYANDEHSYTTPEDEAAAAILEQDTIGEFTRGDRRSSDDDDDDSFGGGAGAADGSGGGRGAALLAPPEPESDADDVQEVIPQHRHDSTISGLQLLGLHTATSTAPCVIEPRNPRQELTGPHSKEWREAMDAEIKILESYDTWVLVDRAAIKGRRILSGKWVFRVKTAADGTIERFKARWVVRGYDQRHGINFDQTFAPVSRHTSVRILLTIAATRHLLLRQIDVNNAFLYALVDAVKYVEQPHAYGEGDSCVPATKVSLRDQTSAEALATVPAQHSA
ncbi:unnamed protein product [Closterium sp. NIES-54]